MRLLLRVIINAVALWVTAAGRRRFGHRGLLGALARGARLRPGQRLIRPIVKVLPSPLTILTLGLFTFVVNALMLMLVAWFNVGLSIEGGFLTALIGSIVISIVSMLLSSLLGDK